MFAMVARHRRELVQDARRSDRAAPPYRVLTASKSSVRPAMLIFRAIPLLPEPAFAGSKIPEATTWLVAINVRQCADGFTLSPDTHLASRSPAAQQEQG